MSAAKRFRGRPEDATIAAQLLPASKRLKTTNGAHVPAAAAAAAATSGLGFLVDEDARAGRKLGARLTNGVPRSKATRVDESETVIARDLGEEDDEEDLDGSAENADSEAEEDDEENLGFQGGREVEAVVIPAMRQEKAVVNGGDREDDEDAMSIAEDAEEDNSDNNPPEHGELSFGEMLQTRHPDPIDVGAAFPNLTAERQALAPVTDGQLRAIPTGLSLVTVLTQALKTNDKDLLESCLQTNDIDSIRATIQRLPSQHIAVLLQRLAERIHRRPGRTGNLMVWVQWSLIAHGGYLASQPDLLKQLRALAQVVRERAKGLQPLLHLKGKLDMLSAQLELRRQIQLQSRAANAADDDDDENVVYVEGQRDDWSDSEADEAGTEAPRGLRRRDRSKPAADESEDDDIMPNGISHETVEEDSDDDEDEEGEGLLDIEAEETSNDEEEDDDDDDEADSDKEGESEAESDDASIPSEDDDGDESDASGVKEPKPQMLQRKR